MSKAHFEELIHKYPKLMNKFKDKVYHYEDNVKLFLEKCFDSIDYLHNVHSKVKHELMYKLQKQNFEKDGYLFKIDDVATKMYIIQSGTVEIEHTADGERFVIEKLGRGCILN